MKPRFVGTVVIGWLLLLATYLAFSPSERDAPLSAQVSEAATIEVEDWECWDDGELDPCRRTLFDVAFVGEDQGWAVGDGGLIVRWDGESWTRYDSPTDADLFGVDMLSEDQGWIVGELGTVLTWDGERWQVRQLLGGSDYLYDVDFVNPEAGWVVGDRIWHWNGQEWTVQDGPVSPYLRAVSMVDETTGWAVQESEEAMLVHWDGTSWQPFEPLPEALVGMEDYGLWSVDTLPTGEVWVSNPVMVARWDGRAWQSWDPWSSELTLDPIGRVVAEADDSIWLLGDHYGLAHWDGERWRETDEDGAFLVLGLDLLASGDPVAVGEGANIMHREDERWVPIAQPGLRAHFGASVTLDDGRSWAGGYPGKIAHWNGSAWDEERHPIELRNFSVADLVAQPGGDIWLLGMFPRASDRHFVLRNDADGWQEQPVSDAGALSRLASTPDGNMWGAWRWADGEASRYELRRQTSDGWQAVGDFSARAFLSDMEMLNDETGWLVGTLTEDRGYASLVLEWNGQRMVPHEPLDSTRLNAIDVVSTSDAWAVGSERGRATFLHWDGQDWTRSTLSDFVNVQDVELQSSTQGWAVGRQRIFSWDGTRWRSRKSPTAYLYDVSSSDAETWIVGEHGLRLRRVIREVPAAAVIHLPNLSR